MELTGGAVTPPPLSAAVGPPLHRRHVTAAFVVGSVGILAAGLQPILLGDLQAQGRISAAELGHAATLELLALGLGAALGPLLERWPLRPVAVFASLLYAAANLLTLDSRGEAVTLVRGLAGLPGGVMIWVATEAIVRSMQPTRWSAIYFAVQTAAQLAIAALIAAAAPTSPAAAPLAMAGLALAALAAAAFLPARYSPLPREDTASGLPPPRGWAVLAAAVLVNACIVGGWVFLEPLGAQSHVPPATVALATPLSLGCQIVGAVAAALLAARLPWFAALCGSGVLLVLATLGLATLPAAAEFLALEAAVGLVWLFILPFMVPLAIEADPTRRTAVLGSAANLVGSAAGPLAASLIVGEGDARSALLLCAGLGGAALALIFGLHWRRARAHSAP